MIKEYIALFEYEPDENAYSVIFPDLPGCYSYGRDYDEAVKMAHEALSLYADGEECMPRPRSLEQIKTEWEDWPEWENEYKFLVSKVALYPTKSKTQRLNVRMPTNLVARIDRVSRSRSAFLVSAAEQLLSTER